MGHDGQDGLMQHRKFKVPSLNILRICAIRKSCFVLRGGTEKQTTLKTFTTAKLYKTILAIVSVIWVLQNTIYDVCCYNRCHSNDVKEFWDLIDNIYDYLCLLV
jgi:hypothetical protein